MLYSTIFNLRRGNFFKVLIEGFSRVCKFDFNIFWLNFVVMSTLQGDRTSIFLDRCEKERKWGKEKKKREERRENSLIFILFMVVTYHYFLKLGIQATSPNYTNFHNIWLIKNRTRKTFFYSIENEPFKNIMTSSYS